MSDTIRGARHLPDVIDQIIKVIPQTEKGFIEELEDNKSSAEFSSPETIRLRWEMTAETLYNNIGNGPLKAWQQEVVDIWMGKK